VIKNIKSGFYALLILQLFLSLGAYAASDVQQVKWQKFDKKVFAIAKQKNQPVLLLVKADWCPHCHEFQDKTLKDGQIVKYINEHFIPVRVDVDTDKKIALDYRVTGLPTMIILDSDNSIIKTSVGFTAGPETMTYLSQGLQEYEQFKKLEPKN